MSLLTSIPNLVFPGEIDTLEFSGTAAAALDFTLKVDGEQLLEATFSYSSSGRVTVQGLAELVEPFVRDGMLHSLTIEADGSVVKSDVQVLACNLNNASSALEFCHGSFLSVCRVKNTYPGAKEYVSMLLSSAEDMTIDRTWLVDGTIVHSKATQQLQAGLQTIDVSPASMDGRVLLDYEVRVGMRSCLFQMCHDTDSDPVSVAFRNAFGQLETFHFFGVQEKEVKPTRSSAVVGGAYKVYRVETIPTWKTTGRISLLDEVLLAEDLVSSMYAERCSDECPVAITDSDLKPDNSRYGVSYISVTWREEKNARIFSPAYRVKTFDATFDDTFE